MANLGLCDACSTTTARAGSSHEPCLACAQEFLHRFCKTAMECSRVLAIDRVIIRIVGDLRAAESLWVFREGLQTLYRHLASCSHAYAGMTVATSDASVSQGLITQSAMAETLIAMMLQALQLLAHDLFGDQFVMELTGLPPVGRPRNG